MGAENSYGVIGPDLDNPYGCVPCFCFGHSNTCTPASHMVKSAIDATFDYNDELWAGRTGVEYNNVLGQIVSNSSFRFPEKYLGNQRYSYNQFLSFNLGKFKFDRLSDTFTILLFRLGRATTRRRSHVPRRRPAYFEWP